MHAKAKRNKREFGETKVNLVGGFTLERFSERSFANSFYVRRVVSANVNRRQEVVRPSVKSACVTAPVITKVLLYLRDSGQFSGFLHKYLT